ncbi:MAG: sugar phosphate isomerase/epimerase [Verrucomicrobia bacterium]|nr:sugar phosphate isomerase/epimerase [Verrucomicrobiota bacterium]
MNNSPAFSRRAFLQAMGGLALAGAGQPCRGAFAPARLIVSCRDLVLKDTGKSDSWTAMKELGLGGVEVRVEDDLSCPGLFHPTKRYSVATADGVQMLQDELAAHGVVITAFGLFRRGSEWRTQKNISPGRLLVPIAQRLGVKVIRIDVQARKLTSKEFLPAAIRACKHLCEAAEGTQVAFGVENHSMNTNDPAFLQQLLDGVGSKHFGMTLDANNFYWYGWPLQQVYGLYERFAPRVVHTHCKSVRYPANQRNVRRQPDKSYLDHSAPIYDGDIDYRRVAAILRKANYQHDLCLENECLHHFPAAQHLDILKKEVALLKSLA